MARLVDDSVLVDWLLFKDRPTASYHGPYYPQTKQPLHASLNPFKKYNLFEHLHFYSNPTILGATNRPAKPLFNMFLRVNQLTHTHFNGAVLVYDEELRLALQHNFARYFRLFERILAQSFKCELVNRELISLALTISQHALVLNMPVIQNFNLLFKVGLSGQTDRCPNLTLAPFQNSSLLFKFVSESICLSGFVQTCLHDYRHLIQNDLFDFLLMFTPTVTDPYKHVDNLVAAIKKSLINLNDNFFDNDPVFYTFVSTYALPVDNDDDDDGGARFGNFFFRFNIDVLYGNLNSIYLLVKLKTLPKSIHDDLMALLAGLDQYYANKILVLIQAKAQDTDHARCKYIDSVLEILDCTRGLIRNSIEATPDSVDDVQEVLIDVEDPKPDD
jgi:hypothetical protein